MFKRKLVVRRVIALGATILSAAGSGAAFEFDNVDETAVKFEKVLEIVGGKVVFNLNEQVAPERQVAVPFRYVLNNYQVPNINSLIFLDERGEIIFKDAASSGISYPTTYFPARDGSAYLTMEGLCRLPGLFLNPYPETKKLYSSEGRLIWEKRAEGYPRISPNGDYVAVFFASDFHGRITLIGKDGNASEFEGPVGPFHAISKEGDFLLVGETPYVPSDWHGGTTVCSATGKVITHLDPNFACRSAVCLEGDYSIYGSRKIIVQTGFFIERRDGVDPHGNSLTDTDHPKSERGIQVYDGKGRKVWERKLGEGHPGLQFFVSDNEEYIALIPDPAARITLFESETGKIVRTIKTRKIPSSIRGGYVSNDGAVVLLTYQCGVKSGDADTGAVILRGDRVVGEIRLAGTENGRLSGNITANADMLLLNNHREAAVYKLDWLR